MEKMKETYPNKMPKTMIPSKEQQKSIGGKKSKNELKGDQAQHLQGWTTSPTKAN
jgi:hypothetical protein